MMWIMLPQHSMALLLSQRHQRSLSFFKVTTTRTTTRTTSTTTTKGIPTREIQDSSSLYSSSSSSSSCFEKVDLFPTINNSVNNHNNNNNENGSRTTIHTSDKTMKKKNFDLPRTLGLYTPPRMYLHNYNTPTRKNNNNHPRYSSVLDCRRRHRAFSSMTVVANNTCTTTNQQLSSRRDDIDGRLSNETTTTTTTDAATTHSTTTTMPLPTVLVVGEEEDVERIQGDISSSISTSSSQCPFAPSSAFETESGGSPLPPLLPEPKATFLRRVLHEDDDEQQQQQNHSHDDDKNKTNHSSCSSNPDHHHHRRPSVVALDSIKGRQRLLRSLQQNTAQSYWALFNHFSHQSEPMYCGVTTLLVVLNAFAVDPLRRWKSGWRYYGHEDILLQHCTCVEPERIRRTGLTMAQFAQLAACQGLATIHIKRPQSSNNSQHQVVAPAPSTTTINEKKNNDSDNNIPPSTIQSSYASLEDFRRDIIQVLTATPNDDGNSSDDNQTGKYKDDDDDDYAASRTSATTTTSTTQTIAPLTSLMVVSYARSSLGQTGDGGHFSPLAAYDMESDSVLILDVARFKYPPHWVHLHDLYHAMAPIDPTTQQPRGWFILHPPPLSFVYQGSVIVDTAKLSVEQIPALYQKSPCPGQAMKVEYCPNNNKNDDDDGTTNNKNNNKYPSNRHDTNTAKNTTNNNKSNPHALATITTSADQKQPQRQRPH